MAGGDIIIMSRKEFRRVPVIYSVINKQITQQEAANILSLSRRQIIRLVKQVKEKGGIALTHKSRGKPSNRAELAKTKNKILTQMERVFKELGVDVIHADSPQAKGRVERLFRTHQDRLIKEMRLKGINNVKDARKILSLSATFRCVNKGSSQIWDRQSSAPLT